MVLHGVFDNGQKIAGGLAEGNGAFKDLAREISHYEADNDFNVSLLEMRRETQV